MLADNVIKSNVTGLPILQYYGTKAANSFHYAASRCMWCHAAGVRHLIRKEEISLSGNIFVRSSVSVRLLEQGFELTLV